MTELRIEVPDAAGRSGGGGTAALHRRPSRSRAACRGARTARSSSRSCGPRRATVLGDLQAGAGRAPAVGLPARAVAPRDRRAPARRGARVGARARSPSPRDEAPLGAGSLQQFVPLRPRRPLLHALRGRGQPRRRCGASPCSTSSSTTPTARAATCCATPTATSGRIDNGLALPRTSSSCAP